MQQTWRWFGPVDPVRLSDIRQAGATGVVTALHHLPAGVAWPAEEIGKRIAELGADGGAPLPWSVVESLPVSEAIRTQTGDWRAHLDAWTASLEALAAADIRTICYNFMPVLDWTRTDLAAPMGHGGTAMAFDIDTFAAFDIHILERPGAREDYAAETAARADAIAAGLDDAARAALMHNVTCGLPGSTERWSLDALHEGLANYADISPERLMQHHIDFLSEVIPTAERLGMRLCCHPDDPPFPLLGLPRVMSTAAHYRELLAAVDSSAAGMTLCTGSLGARPDNDLPAIAREFGPRIHFVHLRNVTRATETVPCSFFEDEHLSGQADMVAVIEALLAEEARRRAEGRTDAEIPFRPDHGQAILTDLERAHQPGYPAVGRLKGLAELRGVIAALTRPAAAP